MRYRHVRVMAAPFVLPFTLSTSTEVGSEKFRNEKLCYEPNTVQHDHQPV